MQKLAELCVRRPVFATVLILVFVVVGWTGYTKLGVDRFPRVEFPYVTVSTQSPGSSPEAIETEITDKIEEQVNTISGIEELRSYSSEGQSVVSVQFALEKNVDVAAQEVRDKINLVLPQLPKDIKQPVVTKIDPDAAPILTLAISARQPIRDVSEYVDKVLRRQLEGVNGVGSVTLIGARKRQINVWLDAVKMRSFGVTTTDVNRALQNQNVEIPGGRVEAGNTNLTLRTRGRLQTVADFNTIVLKTGNGAQVLLSDVARVEDGVEDELTAAEIAGQPTVLLSIVKQSGTNTLAVIDAIKDRVNTIRTSLPPTYNIQVARDQSDYIKAAVHTVQEHLIVGALLASMVVLIFLWNWRSTLISALAIPTSIIATFALMWIMGFTYNVITLLALSLAVGIVIDDAIVVLENIFRFIEEKRYPPAQAAVLATREIGMAVMATTMALVAVFLPVAFMTGIVGRFMNSFGLTMAFAILVSLLVSFTLTPSLSARWLRSPHSVEEAPPTNLEQEAQSNGYHPEHDDHVASRERGFFAVIDHVYTTLLKWSLAHRWVIVLACFAAVYAIKPLAIAVPKNFLPDDDESQFEITARAPEGTSLQATREIGRRIAKDVQENGKGTVEYTMLSVGTDQQAPLNSATIYVRMLPLEKRQSTSQQDLIDFVRAQILPKYKAEDLHTIIGPVSAFGGGGTASAKIQYALTGPNLNTLSKASEKVLQEFKKVKGVVDADTSLLSGKPELQVHINRSLAEQLNVHPQDIADALRYLIGGDKVTDYNENGEQYEVHVRAEQGYRTNEQGISLLTVPSTSQGAVDLDQVVTMTRTTGPSTIQRLNRQRQVTFTGNTAMGASEAAVTASLQKIIEDQHLGPDYKSFALGRSKEQMRAFMAFLTAVMLSLVFMYLILAAQFESWLHPITILLSLPLTIPFALFSILILGQSVNIFSSLGILVLFGVVKKNAILQIDHTNQLRERGMSRYDALIQANRDRLRPILMTTCAFVAGMLPLVLSTGTGSGTNRATGSVIFGGQTMSLLLTLLATPVAYSLFDDLTNFIARTRRYLFGAGPDVMETAPRAETPSLVKTASGLEE